VVFTFLVTDFDWIRLILLVDCITMSGLLANNFARLTEVFASKAEEASLKGQVILEDELSYKSYIRNR